MARISDIKNNNVLPFVARKQKATPWLNIFVLINILLVLGLYVIVLSK